MLMYNKNEIERIQNSTEPHFELHIQYYNEGKLVEDVPGYTTLDSFKELKEYYKILFPGGTGHQHNPLGVQFHQLYNELMERIGMNEEIYNKEVK